MLPFHSVVMAGTSPAMTRGASLFRHPAVKPPHELRTETMKRIATWAFYAIGTLAILYLALYAYAAFKGRTLEPGDPIHIFRNPNAPDYS
jgi:hypothetical protein